MELWESQAAFWRGDGQQDFAAANYGTASVSVRLGGCTPVVNISVSTNAGTEAGTTAVTVTATTSDPVVGNQTVTLGVSGTNITTGDYTLSNSTITILNGATTGSETFTVADDSVYEGAETATLTINNPSTGIVLGVTTIQDVTIADNDGLPLLNIDDIATAEGSGGGTTDFLFTVSLSNPCAFDVNVSYTTQDNTAKVSNNDYTLNSGTLLIPANSTSGTIAVVVNADNILEPDETFFVHLIGATGGTIADNQGIGTIQNDDTGPTFTISNGSMAEDDAGLTNFVFTVTKNGVTGERARVDFVTADGGTNPATSGVSCGGAVDYVSQSGTLTFRPTDTALTIRVPVCGDTTFEREETFFVNLSNAVNASIADNQGEGTITNDDAQPTISINDVTRNEGAASTTDYDFTISLTNASDQPIMVSVATADGTAKASDSDYTSVSMTPVTIAANTTTEHVHVLVNGDTTFEANEDFFVNLASPSGATPGDMQGKGAITNDDPIPLSLIVTKTDDTNDGFCTLEDCSLREAISNTNDNPAGGAKTIRFGIHVDDARHFYYADDGASGITPANVRQTTEMNDANISVAYPAFPLDPDYPHSWWSIAPASPLPAITAPVWINGYTQLPCPAASPCSQANTDANADNAVLLIEISGANPGAAGNGLAVESSAIGSRIEGLVTNRFTANGLKLSGNAAAVSGNFIGTDVSGTKAAGNNVGVLVDHGSANEIGCSVIAERNLISGNTDSGVTINGVDAVGNLVQGNLIGTDRTGTLALANGGSGVAIYDAVQSVIGLDTSGIGMANLIANNTGPGVEVETGTMTGSPGTENVIRGNSIHDNGGLGIDLVAGPPAPGSIAADGVTPNDSGDGDTGPNNLQNFPIIRTALIGSSNTIRGTLNSTPGGATFTIDLYSSPTCNAVAPNDYGEGKSYLGSTTATATNGAGDALWSFNPASLTAGHFVNATATDSLGNTSEFSKCFEVRAFTAGTISFALANTDDAETNAGKHPVSIIVTRSGGSDGAVSVAYDVTDSTATTGDNDFSVLPASGTFNWANGDSSNRTITITVKGDTKFEPDETVNLTLSNVTGGAVVETNPATLTIKNDDSRPTISINDVSHGEGASGTSDYDFAVSLSNASYLTITVNAATADDTATTANSDYAAVPGTMLTFAPDQTTKHVHVLVNGDLTFEETEQFFVNLSNPNANATILDGQGIGTITNDDTNVSVAVSPSSVAEDGATNVVYTFARNGLTTAPLTVNFSVAGTAAFGTDYTQTGAATFSSASGTVTFGAGNSTAALTVDPSTDLTFEPDETIILTVTSGTGYNVASPSSASVTITNDDAVGGVIRFSSATYNITEGSGSTTITVERVGDTTQAVSVDYATPDDSDATTVAPGATINGIASPRCDFTTALGTLRFAANETSKTFTVLISQDNYVEGPESLTLTLSNLTGGAVFGTPATATVEIADDATEPATNPIDDARNFVRQHYHDFLNREPDTEGLNFWTNEITSCGADPQCIEVKRINVSAAFYLSIEFQDTGYLIERMYKASYGDASGTSTIGGVHQIPVPIIRFNEFLTDTQQIGHDVIVGQTGWEMVLNNNKAAFAAQFVKRPRFTTAYPNTLTPAQFVNVLFANTGVTPSSMDRQAAIDEFDRAGTSADATARGRALRRVAENGTFAQTELNRAFVLMQYFGYLRRNPNVAPDSDHGGYDYWLTKLNQFNGNFVNAEMGKAFLVSDEYRDRFGP